MIKIAKKKIKIKKVPFNRSDRSIKREIFTRQPNIKKLKKHTKYVPLINLTQGIASVLFRNLDD